VGEFVTVGVSRGDNFITQWPRSQLAMTVTNYD